jgi:putative transposase
MPNYRRLFVPGGTYFFTVNLRDRSSDLLTREIDELRRAWREVAERYPFETVAAVVLPDHLHCIWRLPPDDSAYPLRWRLLKSWFSMRVARKHGLKQGRRTGELGVWQRRFWEHAIRDADDLQAHIDYVHFNPVKHGHVAEQEDWPYSTLRSYAAEIVTPV